MTGYSGTPLAKKLGIKSNSGVMLINPPNYYMELFRDMHVDVHFIDGDAIRKDLIHFFTKSLDEFKQLLPALMEQIKPDGMIWVSWPKKASKVVTDITEDLIRNYALSIGLVDIKVCAVDDVWSGLKLVIPVRDRKYAD
jgi:hypothetical protein